MSATVIAGRIIPIISRILNFTRLKSRFSLTFAGGSFCARMRGRNAGGLKHPPLLGFAQDYHVGVCAPCYYAYIFAVGGPLNQRDLIGLEIG